MAKTRSSTDAAAAKNASEDKQASSNPPLVKESAAAHDHLPPIFLVFTVMVCSGFVFMYAFRDVFATGRTIGGFRDHAYLVRIEYYVNQEVVMSRLFCFS